MSWRDRLQTGSFRGVEFQFDAGDRPAGRRLQTHEYPLRDDPFTEDLGRSSRTYRIDAYLVGPGYLDVHDRLLAALEEAGAGELIHPFYGAVQVMVDGGSTRISHSKDEGGMCRISMQFVEAGEQRFPAARVSSSHKLLDAANGLQEAADDSFLNNFSFSGWPAFVADATDQLLQKAGFTLPSGWSASDALSLLTDGIGSLDQAAVYELSASGVPIPGSAATPARARIQDNARAVDRLIRQSALVRLAQDAAAREWVVYDDAMLSLRRISGLIDDAMLTADDGTYDALRSVRAAVVAHIREQATDASRLMTYQPVQPQPALAIAYRLYGDANRAEEIVTRNGLPHPGFIDQSITVLEPS
ncbi:MAG: DNA circularization N-terminal domain-containing protein [Gammaproteobacteria bacterium]|nr:DNA circularization N-terminal domain-containing protein [Gammaproteobacteria bacterium]